jgi:hypothetical protein
VNYGGIVPAFVVVTEKLIRRALTSETPVRLRLWAYSATLVAVALLAVTSLLMARVQEQVRTIGDDAVPRAATASDLYFALSDMDAQVARMVLIGDTDTLAGSQIDALGTYRERGLQVDTDLQHLLSGATSDADRAAALELLHHLAVYRQRVWQTLTAQTQSTRRPTSPGTLPPDALGYYTQATNVLHLDLLPTAKRLREASESRLDESYADKRVTAMWGTGLTAGLGVGLMVLLIGLQVWLARRFHRVLNPALLVATGFTVALVVSMVAILGAQQQRLDRARDDSLEPYLALSRAQAVSYDAAADTSRYLISANLPHYKQDFIRKSDCLVRGGSCGRSGDTIDGGLAILAAGSGASRTPPVLDRWVAYQRVHQRIVTLADSGKAAEAIDRLTGIRRGDAAFDFSYFDAAVSDAATARKRAFDEALRDTEQLLAGWTVIPLSAMGLVILLVPFGVRKRLAEYR